MSSFFLDSAQFQIIKKNIQAGANLISDSRRIKKGDWFVSYPIKSNDRQAYISSAVALGAAGIIYESGTVDHHYDVPMIPITDLRRHAGELAAELLNNNSDHPIIIGITGTNGKTSISQSLAQALEKLNHPAGTIGTNGHGFWGKLTGQANTTPDAITLQTLIYQLKQANAHYIVMEVSSHGLEQFRVNGVPFTAAIFTNLTRDHLDYHHTFEAYFSAKKRLFYYPTLRHVLINQDDFYGARLLQELRGNRPELHLISYGQSAKADIQLTVIKSNSRGMQLALNTPWGVTKIKSSLLGLFNAYNLAACVGLLCDLEFALDHVTQVLSEIKGALGRMQAVHYPGCATVIIDYAHTPDALRNVLVTLKANQAGVGKLWCVFGCGGERDKGKRPLMGQVADECADQMVITSDNPRGEDPQSIINDIILPLKKAVFIEPDRERAIAYAIEHSKVEDIVLIAGKGHENYQEIAGMRHYFDDKEVAKRYLRCQEK